MTMAGTILLYLFLFDIMTGNRINNYLIENRQWIWMYVLYTNGYASGIFNNLVSLIFALDYDKSSRDLPIMFKRISLQLQYEKEKKENQMLADSSNFYD